MRKICLILVLLFLLFPVLGYIRSVNAQPKVPERSDNPDDWEWTDTFKGSDFRDQWIETSVWDPNWDSAIGLIRSILMFVFLILNVVMTLMIFWGIFKWMKAGDNEEELQMTKKGLWDAILGWFTSIVLVILAQIFSMMFSLGNIWEIGSYLP